MSLNKLFFAASLVISLFANASVFEKELSANMLAGVKLAKSGSVKIDNANIPLTQVSAGLRTKNLVVTDVNVYVAELFVSEPNNFKKSDAEVLASLGAMKTIVMQLTFLRDVEAESVQSSFKDAFFKNKVSTKDEAIKQLLTAVVQGGEATKGKNLTFVISKNADGSETLFYETTTDQVTKIVGSNLSTKILSMWLGVSADSGLEKLKAEMLK